MNEKEKKELNEFLGYLSAKANKNEKDNKILLERIENIKIDSPGQTPTDPNKNEGDLSFDGVDMNTTYTTFDTYSKYVNSSNSIFNFFPIVVSAKKGTEYKLHVDITYEYKTNLEAVVNFQLYDKTGIKSESTDRIKSGIFLKKIEYSHICSTQDILALKIMVDNNKNITIKNIKVVVEGINVRLLSKVSKTSVFFQGGKYYLTKIVDKKVWYAVLPYGSFSELKDELWTKTEIEAESACIALRYNILNGKIYFNEDEIFLCSVSSKDFFDCINLKTNAKYYINSGNFLCRQISFSLCYQEDNANYCPSICAINFPTNYKEIHRSIINASKNTYKNRKSTTINKLIPSYGVSGYYVGDEYLTTITPYCLGCNHEKTFIGRTYSEMRFDKLPSGIFPTMYTKDGSTMFVFLNIFNKIIKYTIDIKTSTWKILSQEYIGDYQKYYLGYKDDYFVEDENGNLLFYKNSPKTA